MVSSRTCAFIDKFDLNTNPFEIYIQMHTKQSIICVIQPWTIAIGKRWRYTNDIDNRIIGCNEYRIQTLPISNPFRYHCTKLECILSMDRPSTHWRSLSIEFKPEKYSKHMSTSESSDKISVKFSLIQFHVGAMLILLI